MEIVNLDNVPKEPLTRDIFTGTDVKKQNLLSDSREYEMSNVNFGKGMRCKFHSHDAEQILIVTAGTGIVATEQKERVVKPGDVILIPKGEKHWHGSDGTSEFSHISIYKKGTKYNILGN
jgi:quercetin dioxygenase-like cupin family protein